MMHQIPENVEYVFLEINGAIVAKLPQKGSSCFENSIVNYKYMDQSIFVELS